MKPADPEHIERDKAIRRHNMIIQIQEKALIWLNVATICALGVILYHNIEKWVS